MEIKKRSCGIFVLLMFVFSSKAFAQTKQINHQSQTWFGIVTSSKLKKKWNLIADVHLRRSSFLVQPNMYIVRAGLSYDITDQLSAATGYGHFWQATNASAYKSFANENRIFQQLVYNFKKGKLAVSQKLRNEQRWQEVVQKDASTHRYRFTNRIRYLLNFNLPLKKRKSSPSLVLSEEVCIQFGKEVTYNTFDQNRLFLGLKQPITKNMSIEIGYMNVYQQRSNGYQFDNNDVFRCFLYWNPNLAKGILR